MKTPSKTIPTRDRILTAARHLFQQRGYYAVGVAEILKAARAPKGSMYHHFPGGKEQIAVESVAKIHTDVLETMRKLHVEGNSPAGMILVMAEGMSRWLKVSGWREGTLLAATTIGCVPALPKVHGAVKSALAAWRDELETRLVAEHWNKIDARRLALTVLAAMEGAMLLARVDCNEKTVLSVAASLSQLIAKPKSRR